MMNQYGDQIYVDMIISFNSNYFMALLLGIFDTYGTRFVSVLLNVLFYKDQLYYKPHMKQDKSSVWQ